MYAGRTVSFPQPGAEYAIGIVHAASPKYAATAAVGMHRLTPSAAMHIDPTRDLSPDAFYAALWFSALRLATGAVTDPLPADLERFAAEYFALFPPVAKA